MVYFVFTPLCFILMNILYFKYNLAKGNNMIIKNAIFCMLICGLFCSLDVFGMKSDEIHITEDEKGRVNAMLGAIKDFAQQCESKYYVGDTEYHFAASWASLGADKNVGIIENLKEDHYNDIVMICNTKNILQDFKKDSDFAYDDITEMLYVIYWHNKKSLPHNENYVMNLIELNIRKVPLLLQRNNKLLSKHDTLVRANGLLVKTNKELSDKIIGQDTTIFRLKLFGVVSSLAFISLLAYLVFKSR